MTLLIPSRIVRLAFFTLSAGCAGFISAETTAMTLCVLVIIAACCRHPVRLELVLAGIAAFAARYSGGTIQGFQTAMFILLPLIIALGGLYLMARTVFGPPSHDRRAYRNGRRWL
jgi:ribose/xylose/arabinose/galactoside ABC-type transport system permease subunit